MEVEPMRRWWVRRTWWRRNPVEEPRLVNSEVTMFIKKTHLAMTVVLMLFVPLLAEIAVELIPVLEGNLLESSKLYQNRLVSLS